MRLRKAVRAFAMAMGMFTAIPMPSRPWDDDCVPWMLPALPLVGLVVGVLWGLGGLLCRVFGLAHPLAAAILALLPILITGGLHVDGFMDVSDALLSRRPQEDKLRILKDPHTGAFAVLMLGALLLLQFAAVWSLLVAGRSLGGLLAVAVFSRGMMAMLVMTRPTIATSGYAKMFGANVKPEHKALAIGCMVGCALAVALCGGLRELVALLLMGLMFAVVASHAERQLGGINGDVAGYALTIAELCGLIVLAC